MHVYLHVKQGSEGQWLHYLQTDLEKDAPIGRRHRKKLISQIMWMQLQHQSHRTP